MHKLLDVCPCLRLEVEEEEAGVDDSAFDAVDVAHARRERAAMQHPHGRVLVDGERSGHGVDLRDARGRDFFRGPHKRAVEFALGLAGALDQLDVASPHCPHPVHLDEAGRRVDGSLN
eukprot:CAMPEP_0180242322 /NCGR_PEP_ID=MMETSP0987-20121128/33147_1 /TAXON_ID=697907 /ORGANISM="non described non described, Strain CCMP2293" /LENGTH=117 /DNA_ID=CAMNT_0022209399 /DNA_START=70 /DNA_END=420 /DNA_ORIENTATION=+